MVIPEIASFGNPVKSADLRQALKKDSKSRTGSAEDLICGVDLAKLVHRSKKNVVYKILKEALINHRWQSGEKRSFAELSNILKVSRTPVAEAYKLLEKEGWIIIRPQVGVEVVQIFKEEVIENLKIRGVLEGLAGSEAMNYLEEKDFKKLREFLMLMKSTQKNHEFEKFIEWNQAFHRMIYNASRMEQLIRTLDQYWDNGKRYRAFYKHLPNILADSNRHHNKILFALRTKNKDLVRLELQKDSWGFGEKLSKYFLHKN